MHGCMLRACSTPFALPQAQRLDIPVGHHPYLKVRASRKAPSCRANPFSSTGRVLNQEDDPFCSAKDRAFLSFAVTSLCTPSALLQCISLLWFFTSLESLFNSASVCDLSISSLPRIEFIKGSVTFLELLYSWWATSSNISIPSPPSRVGRANILLSTLFIACHPVIAGIRSCLKTSSIGCSRCPMVTVYNCHYLVCTIADECHVALEMYCYHFSGNAGRTSFSKCIWMME